MVGYGFLCRFGRNGDSSRCRLDGNSLIRSDRCRRFAVEGHIVEQLELAGQDSAAFGTVCPGLGFELFPFLLGFLQIHHRFVEHLLLLAFRFLQDEVGFLTGRDLDIFCRLLGQHERTVHGRFHLFVLRQLILQAVAAFLQFAIFPVYLFVVAGDVVHEGIDVFLAVAAEAAFKFFVVNIHWCKHGISSV